MIDLQKLNIKNKIKLFKKLYQEISGKGIQGDTELAHINTEEAQLLKLHGGAGTINEETSILGLRALNIRDAHERPEAMEEASTPFVGLESNKVLLGISLLESSEKRVIYPVEDYEIDNVSNKIIRLILSYSNYQIPKK
jgi:UDP-N-acetylglucosamine 2-epimerase